MTSSQRTALVTGGNRGLGAAIARALHDAGHGVIVAHTPGNTKIGPWQREQAAQGYTFTAYEVDVSITNRHRRWRGASTPMATGSTSW